jgi:hypothetical protein
MTKTTPEQNKALVLAAFDTLFNRRDYAAAERFWSDRYIQHSAHIAPGRSGLFDLIRAVPETLRTGTSCRTKRPERTPSAGCRCSATVSPPDRSLTSNQGDQS